MVIDAWRKSSVSLEVAQRLWDRGNTVSLMKCLTFKCVTLKNIRMKTLFALPFLGGAVASKPLQRQLAAHLCELEPEGGSLAGLPRGEAEGRGSRTGSRTSHQTWRSADTGAGAGECTVEGVKVWMNDILTDWRQVGLAGFSKQNLIWFALQTTADCNTSSK